MVCHQAGNENRILTSISEYWRKLPNYTFLNYNVKK